MRRCHPSPMIGRWSVVIRSGHAPMVYPADGDPLKEYYYWVGFTADTNWPGVTAVELWHGNDLAKAWDREAPTDRPATSSRVGTNSGHGHVWKRPDGMLARCGGPALCRECAADAALVAKGGA